MKSENFLKFMKYYGKDQKSGLFLFSILSTIAGFAEFFGIAMVYPFIVLIINPEIVNGNRYYRQLIHIFNLKGSMSCAFVLGLILILVFILKNILMIFIVYCQTKIAGKWKLEINKRYMDYFLNASYKDLMKTSPASKIYILDYLTSQTLDLFVIRGVNLVTNIIIVSLI